MALYKYFKRESFLPNPESDLSKYVPSSAIRQANEEVEPLINGEITPAKKKRPCPYNVFTAEEKATIAKRAAELGVTNTIRFFKKKFTDRKLKESTVRLWVKRYKQVLASRKKQGKENMEVAKLENMKRGRPLMLGEVLDRQVQMYIKTLRSKGCHINTAIVMATALGIVKNRDSNLLSSNGGHIEISKHWGKHFLARLGYVKRRGNTKSKVSVENFELLKNQFLFDIKTITAMEDIPEDLIINWDHTGLNYVPVSKWTMAEEGSKRVEIVGLDDKRQITAVFGCSMRGDFLPPQIIYSGKTPRCLPSVKFADNWHITYTANHWANEETSLAYIEKILTPYVNQKRRELSLDIQHPALVIFDRFKGQCTSSVLLALEKQNFLIVVVPANCTDRLQPLDVSLNKSAKEFLRRKFHEWYADQVRLQLQNCEDESSHVDLKLSVIKPLGATWLKELYDYFKMNSDIIKNGFKGAGIVLN